MARQITMLLVLTYSPEVEPPRETRALAEGWGYSGQDHQSKAESHAYKKNLRTLLLAILMCVNNLHKNLPINGIPFPMTL
jgi:hypothetical protein